MIVMLVMSNFGVMIAYCHDNSFVRDSIFLDIFIQVTCSRQELEINDHDVVNDQFQGHVSLLS